MGRTIRVAKDEAATELRQTVIALAIAAALIAGWLGGYYIGINEERPIKMIEIGGVEG
jgi:F0F1-type ATP synthase assembly protein I